MTRYVIATPVRNEERYLEHTIKSVLRQTVLPVEWVIIDDGSTDKTAAIIDRYAAQCPWVRAVHRPDRGSRNAAVGAIQALHDGYRSLQSADWQFLVNLDADLKLEWDYFESCFQEFRRDPRLGIAGGTLYHFEKGVLQIEANPSFHVRGATKIYRRACWDDIGGPPCTAAWDTLDEVKANMLGWRSRSLHHVTALHLRPTGAVGGCWKDSVKSGRSEYYAGYHPLFMLSKCIKRTVRNPLSVNGVGHLWGFVSALVRGAPRTNDVALIRYVQSQQLRRLIGLDTVWK
jgi:poly-beta-1,6-N-acetyl-D-glucosamine synthase